ncbi:NAD(P)H-dependent oxidoreductase [Zhongshania aliphaticivorans]|uniref:NAD(P)H-dependent oxidoreductase n=1 Tax=Zhongshania aliphaticivorans TaxID=1470434 RepID=UPI0012E56B8E|nr:NAD(P)H-dependent oxidoreductase [Zhongshania aliphaticivorans]CAA0101374.1 Glutathione-regulated potassium-efflux system ancillary protein KefF [Zhongshania aliphaticivorans]
MKIFIVFAHPEENSFGASLLQRSIEQLRLDGHEVQVSDLYRMGFNPVATASDFQERRFPEQLQYDREQKYAAKGEGGFSSDIQEELDKLFWCDHLILQFPLWWFSVPAIMKGWIDRVFVNGAVYGAGLRWENGGLKGRSASLSITTGCLPEMVQPNGVLGDLRVILWHLHAGVFHYSGLDVYEPFVAYSLRYQDADERLRVHDAYAMYLGEIEGRSKVDFHDSSEFENWMLRDGVTSRTVGQLACEYKEFQRDK